MLMLRSLRAVFVTAICLAVPTVTASVAAAAPTTVATDRPSPRSWLEEKVRQGHKLAAQKVKPDTPEERAWQAEAKTLIDDILHWDELTRRSLGSNWRKRSASEQRTFQALLRKLIESSYRSRLRYAVREDALDRKQEVDIDWLEEDVRSSKASLVAKVSAGTASVLLGFKLTWVDERWRVYDVAIDDLSTVRTYRSNFNKILKRDGWKGLVARLKSKIADIEAGRSDFARPSLTETP